MYFLLSICLKKNQKKNQKKNKHRLVGGALGPLALAEAQGVEHRVHLAGFIEPAKAVGLFDVFALSSRSEQFPISVVAAKEDWLTIGAPRVGGVAAMVASENGPLLSAPGDETGLAHALHTLAADPALRKRIGKANSAKAAAEYDEKRMIERYRALYGGLTGRR